ncbi:hypothetical protein H1W37_19525 [Stappia taiwanensis]|uniref:Uncharacterized protein n=1 Tax=Stappia taiwanensis TaxID=992267 RepID=A0A838Y3V5_9HYPH|nr:hypothetical protein [Stappia taiwanensis]MBA4613854.1 hypothetical protein [Stappia taiwanensis]GGE79002.1 hypothetical protein GCM10007285_03540 [Stappia taiwanensis]
MISRATIRKAFGSRLVWALALVILAVGLHLWRVGLARDEGYQARVTDELRDDLDAYRKRSEDDAHARSLSDYDLCHEYLGAGGLPDDECDRLRRPNPQ